MSVLERLDAVITALSDFRDELAKQDDPPADPAPADQGLRAVTEQPARDAEQVETAANGHDNTLPFKCPACGKTFAEQTACTNNHPPVQTLPTTDVIEGATPEEVKEEASADGSDGSANSSSTTPPSADGTNPASPPTWPS